MLKSSALKWMLKRWTIQHMFRNVILFNIQWNVSQKFLNLQQQSIKYHKSSKYHKHFFAEVFRVFLSVILFENLRITFSFPLVWKSFYKYCRIRLQLIVHVFLFENFIFFIFVLASDNFSCEICNEICFFLCMACYDLSAVINF